MPNLISLFFLIGFFLPLCASARVLAGDVACDGTSEADQAMARFESLTDDQIRENCRRDMTAWEKSIPGRTATNEKRTDICSESFEKMRKLSKEYQNSKRQFCASALNPKESCVGSSAQEGCLEGAFGSYSRNAKALREMNLALQASRRTAVDLLDFNRLRHKAVNDDLKAIRVAVARSPADAPRILSGPSLGRFGGEGPGLNSSRTYPETNKSGISAPEDRPLVESVSQSPVSPASSGVSGRYAPAATGDVLAREGGYTTLGDYQRNIPLLLRENERVTRELTVFKTAVETKIVQQEKQATKMEEMASQLLVSMKNMGELPGSDAAAVKIEAGGTRNAKAGSLNAEGGLEQWDEERNAAEPTKKAESEKKEKQKQVDKAEKPAVAEVALTPTAPLSSFEEAQARELGFPPPVPGKPRTEQEKASLRRLLRQKLAAAKSRSAERGADAAEMEGSSGVVKELLSSAREQNRNTVGRSARSVAGILDVEGAVQDVEEQLRELDRAMGILEADSLSLFQRVKLVLRRQWR